MREVPILINILTLNVVLRLGSKCKYPQLTKVRDNANLFTTSVLLQHTATLRCGNRPVKQLGTVLTGRTVLLIPVNLFRDFQISTKMQGNG